MIVTSTSTPLPGGVVSGVSPSAGVYAFNNIWDTPTGAIPAGWVWNGREDLKIQRIDLSDLFIQSILNNRDPNFTAYYTVDGVGPTAVPPLTSPPIRYYIRSTKLTLLNATPVVEYSELIQESTAFTLSWPRGRRHHTWDEASASQGLWICSGHESVLECSTKSTRPERSYSDPGAGCDDRLHVQLRCLSDAGHACYNGQFTGQGNPPNNVSDAQTAMANLTSDIINPN
jgi:hypothetical protein